MKKNPKALVIISTFNGEKYIEEQLNSIINQTYKNIEIMVRDDCSTDKTYNILKKYEKEYDFIQVERGKKNLGYPKCFYELTNNAKKADYYFFADQDDIWLENKIERAIKIIETEEDINRPFAYYSGYKICDSNMNVVGSSKKRINNIKFKDTLYEVCGLEFTMAINNKALELLNSNKPIKSKARGTWMSMLYSAFGIVYYDNYETALYRRHEKSVTSNKMSGLGLWKWRIKKFFSNKNFENYKTILNEFYKICNAELDDKDLKIIKLFTNYSFINRFRKTFYLKRLRSNIIDELALRLMFLIGKL